MAFHMESRDSPNSSHSSTMRVKSAGDVGTSDQLKKSLRRRSCRVSNIEDLGLKKQLPESSGDKHGDIPNPLCQSISMRNLSNHGSLRKTGLSIRSFEPTTKEAMLDSNMSSCLDNGRRSASAVYNLSHDERHRKDAFMTLDRRLHLSEQYSTPAQYYNTISFTRTPSRSNEIVPSHEQNADRNFTVGKPWHLQRAVTATGGSSAASRSLPIPDVLSHVSKDNLEKFNSSRMPDGRPSNGWSRPPEFKDVDRNPGIPPGSEDGDSNYSMPRDLAKTALMNLRSSISGSLSVSGFKCILRPTPDFRLAGHKPMKLQDEPFKREAPSKGSKTVASLFLEDFEDLELICEDEANTDLLTFRNGPSGLTPAAPVRLDAPTTAPNSSFHSERDGEPRQDSTIENADNDMTYSKNGTTNVSEPAQHLKSVDEGLYSFDKRVTEECDNLIRDVASSFAITSSSSSSSLRPYQSIGEMTSPGHLSKSGKNAGTGIVAYGDDDEDDDDDDGGVGDKFRHTENSSCNNVAAAAADDDDDDDCDVQSRDKKAHVLTNITIGILRTSHSSQRPDGPSVNGMTSESLVAPLAAKTLVAGVAGRRGGVDSGGGNRADSSVATATKSTLSADEEDKKNGPTKKSSFFWLPKPSSSSSSSSSLSRNTIRYGRHSRTEGVSGRPMSGGVCGNMNNRTDGESVPVDTRQIHRPLSSSLEFQHNPPASRPSTIRIDDYRVLPQALSKMKEVGSEATVELQVPKAFDVIGSRDSSVCNSPANSLRCEILSANNDGGRSLSVTPSDRNTSLLAWIKRSSGRTGQSPSTPQFSRSALNLPAFLDSLREKKKKDRASNEESNRINTNNNNNNNNKSSSSSSKMNNNNNNKDSSDNHNTRRNPRINNSGFSTLGRTRERIIKSSISNSCSNISTGTTGKTNGNNNTGYSSNNNTGCSSNNNTGCSSSNNSNNNNNNNTGYNTNSLRRIQSTRKPKIVTTFNSTGRLNREELISSLFIIHVTDS